MAETDLVRIKSNVAKMVTAGAPEADIDAYLAGEGTTPAAIRGVAVAPAADYADKSVIDVAKEAVSNIPSSAVEQAGNLVQPFIHPIDTAKSLKDLAVGALQKAGIVEGGDSIKYADALGQHFADRYGSVAGFKKAIATDPVGVALDISTVLTAGGSALARAPGVVGKVGEVVKTAGDVTNPLNAVGASVKLAGKGTAALLAKTSGTSYDAVVRAAEAGGKGIGSAESNAFWANASKSAPIADVVDQAQAALAKLQKDAGAEYRSGMAAVSKDKTILSFDPLDTKIAEMNKVAKFGTQELEATKGVRTEIAAEISNWRKLDPAQYHTPEGFDFLKQKLGEIKEAQEYGTQSWKIANEAYNAVRKTIADQAPVYDKVMKGYGEAKDALSDLTKELSLNKKANPATALRKLQSAMRDGVNVAYGYRKELLDKLVDNGAATLPHALAGQELSTLFPRGLVGDMLTRGAAAAGLSGGAAVGAHAGVAAGLGPLALGAPLAFSPKIVGTAAYGAGLGGRVLGRPTLGLAAAEIGRQTQP